MRSFSAVFLQASLVALLSTVTAVAQDRDLLFLGRGTCDRSDACGRRFLLLFRRFSSRSTSGAYCSDRCGLFVIPGIDECGTCKCNGGNAQKCDSQQPTSCGESCVCTSDTDGRPACVVSDAFEEDETDGCRVACTANADCAPGNICVDYGTLGGSCDSDLCAGVSNAAVKSSPDPFRICVPPCLKVNND